ncbi:MAG: L,D-transpeptidase family protein [Lachnospiraceae bacterium]|nr:L,D-transpeptidase family protein [Lachnospiraceae bacterium]
MDNRTNNKRNGTKGRPVRNIEVSKLQELRRLNEDKQALTARQEENARIVEELRRRELEERNGNYARTDNYDLPANGIRTGEGSIDVINVNKEKELREKALRYQAYLREEEQRAREEDRRIRELEEEIKKRKALAEKERSAENKGPKSGTVIKKNVKKASTENKPAQRPANDRNNDGEALGGNALKPSRSGAPGKPGADAKTGKPERPVKPERPAKPVNPADTTMPAGTDSPQKAAKPDKGVNKKPETNAPANAPVKAKDTAKTSVNGADTGKDRKDPKASAAPKELKEDKDKKAVNGTDKSERGGAQKPKDLKKAEGDSKSEKTVSEKETKDNAAKAAKDDIKKSPESSKDQAGDKKPESGADKKTEEKKDEKSASGINDKAQEKPEKAPESDKNADVSDTPPVEKKPKKNYLLLMVKHPAFRICLISAAALLFIVYISGMIYYKSRFYPLTTVNGIDCSKKGAAETEALIREKIVSYTLTVNGRNGVTGVISSSDITLNPVFNGEVAKAIKAQKTSKWPFELNKPHELEIEEITYYSASGLAAAVSKLPFFDPKNIRQPVDAYVGDVTDEGYVVTKEDNGSVPIKDAIVMTVSEACDTLETEVSIDNDSCYKTADIRSDDPKLNELIDNLNEYCAAKITYVFGDKTEVLDAEKINEWISVEGTEVTFDESKVSEYVTALAKKYDTFGQPHKLKTHTGEEITITAGAYGWWIDRPAETEALIDAIKSGYRGERTPVYKSEGAVYGENDYGDNYVEVDLTEQHLWVYVDGKVAAESDLVSGNVSQGNGTHTGIYGITYKEENATLRGANYASHVSYWMPFNGNEGMHDATWRSSFGGDIYLTNGSHGCVNLPLSNAGKIFSLVEKGEAVIVYGGKSYTPPAQQTLDNLTPEQQLALLIQAGLINPDGTIPVPADNVENQE